MTQTTDTKKAGNRVFELINNKLIIGETELIETERGTEVLIKNPFTIVNGNITPYLYKELLKAPGAIQIHPLNILASWDISEFPDVQNAHLRATTNIILS